MGAIGLARVDVQLVGEFQAIVDIDCFAGHVLVRALVLDAAADAAGHAGAEQGGQLFLGFVFDMTGHLRLQNFACRRAGRRRINSLRHQA